jgi:hypothetical protein
MDGDPSIDGVQSIGVVHIGIGELKAPFAPPFDVTADLFKEADGAGSMFAPFDFDSSLPQLDSQIMASPGVKVMVHSRRGRMRLDFAAQKPLLDYGRDRAPVEPSDFGCYKHSVFSVSIMGILWVRYHLEVRSCRTDDAETEPLIECSGRICFEDVECNRYALLEGVIDHRSDEVGSDTSILILGQQRNVGQKETVILVLDGNAANVVIVV